MLPHGIESMYGFEEEIKKYKYDEELDSSYIALDYDINSPEVQDETSTTNHPEVVTTVKPGYKMINVPELRKIEISPTTKPTLPTTSTLDHEEFTTESPQRDESMKTTVTTETDPIPSTIPTTTTEWFHTTTEMTTTTTVNFIDESEAIVITLSPNFRQVQVNITPK